MSISAVVLTKNEEEQIARCLASLSWCGETLVIDSNSSDKTVEIAKSAGAKVYLRSLRDDFAQQRNFALSKAQNDWVLFVDADEIITDELRNEIMSISITKGDYDGFYILRKDVLWGKELKFGDAGGAKLVRLGKKSKGSWRGKVHERWQIEGRLGELTQHLYHYPHQSVEEFLREINYYSDIRAKDLYDRLVSVSIWQVIVYPKVKFFVNYVLKLGFLDGTCGLIHAIIMSFHSFLVRAKLWLLWQQKKQVKT